MDPKPVLDEVIGVAPWMLLSGGLALLLTIALLVLVGTKKPLPALVGAVPMGLPGVVAILLSHFRLSGLGATHESAMHAVGGATGARLLVPIVGMPALLMAVFAGAGLAVAKGPRKPIPAVVGLVVPVILPILAYLQGVAIEDTLLVGLCAATSMLIATIVAVGLSSGDREEPGPESASLAAAALPVAVGGILLGQRALYEALALLMMPTVDPAFAQPTAEALVNTTIELAVPYSIAMVVLAGLPSLIIVVNLRAEPRRAALAATGLISIPLGMALLVLGHPNAAAFAALAGH